MSLLDNRKTGPLESFRQPDSCRDAGELFSIEKKILYPIILVISLLGAFSINKQVFDVGVCVVFGVIGWLMSKYEFPLSPILLALILEPMCEQNFVRFMDLNNGNFGAIVNYPIAIGFFVVAVGVIIFSLINQQKINKREKANAAKDQPYMGNE